MTSPVRQFALRSWMVSVVRLRHAGVGFVIEWCFQAISAHASSIDCHDEVSDGKHNSLWHGGCWEILRTGVRVVDETASSIKGFVNDCWHRVVGELLRTLVIRASPLLNTSRPICTSLRRIRILDIKSSIPQLQNVKGPTQWKGLLNVSLPS